MSKKANEKNIGETKNKKLQKELTIDKAKTEIVNKIIDKIKDLLDDQTLGRDSAEGVITLFEYIFQPILQYTNTYKNQKGDKKERKNRPGTMARTKAKVRRLNRSTFVVVLGHRIRNKNNEQKTIYV